MMTMEKKVVLVHLTIKLLVFLQTNRRKYNKKLGVVCSFCSLVFSFILISTP